MEIIRWVAHADYVLRWSFWLHHPLAATVLTVAVLGAVGIWMWRTR